MCLICKSRLKFAISSTSAIESESGEVTPAWWGRAFILLCSGLYQPTRVDRVQHVLSWAEGAHNHAPIIISYIYIYISPTCWISQFSADKCMNTAPHLHICSVHAQQQKAAHWTYQWGKTCCDLRMGQNLLCDFHEGLPFLLEGHCCLGDISVPKESSVIAGKCDTAVQVCGAVHLTHLLPMAKINNKTWYKRLKVSKTAHKERRRNQCMSLLP